MTVRKLASRLEDGGHFGEPAVSGIQFDCFDFLQFFGEFSTPGTFILRRKM